MLLILKPRNVAKPPAESLEPAARDRGQALLIWPASRKKTAGAECGQDVHKFKAEVWERIFHGSGNEPNSSRSAQFLHYRAELLGDEGIWWQLKPPRKELIHPVSWGRAFSFLSRGSSREAPTCFLPSRAFGPLALLACRCGRFRWTGRTANPLPTKKLSCPDFRCSTRPFRFLRYPSLFLPGNPGFLQADCVGCWNLKVYGRCGVCDGGVACGGSARNHRERLLGARRAASSVYQAHWRGAAQPGWRPPVEGATFRASRSQVPATHAPAG
nr:Bardet-Biedl syndrome 10 protein isoform X3 [Odocoileus virginianus texanus]